ncbi:ATP-binding cassette domain-containing protein [Vallitaleaceae bacterium 9-2]
MIRLNNLTKKYKNKTAVNNLNITFTPGVVTGFLGPNGSGKSTTMKMIISLVHPTSGDISVDDNDYKSYKNPTKKIGTLIDPATIDVDLTAKQHLYFFSIAANISQKRIYEVLKMTGLESVKDNKVKTYSLGMKQRLGIATALINDPDVVILDEPFNGLDVDGIHWIRRLLKKLSSEGKTVIVSSHLMGEIQAVADRVIIIARGKLLANMSIDELNEKTLTTYSYVEAENLEEMEKVLKLNGGNTIRRLEGLEVRGLDSRLIGSLASKNHQILYQLKDVQPTLEEFFIDITEGKVDYISEQKEI